MNRRELIGTIGMGAAALLTRMPAAFAGQADGPDLSVEATISGNHGHEVALSVSDVIGLLRATHASGTAAADIQGTSGHTHALSFTVLSLMALLISGEIRASASETFGHTHSVVITLGAPALG